MLLSQLFPHKVCINLDRRADRWQRMQADFARHGIDGVQRFPAVDGSTMTLPPGWRHTAGAFGCLLSHVNVIEEARARKAESVLIFEDDTILDPEFTPRFAAFAGEVPADWDMLYFGALHKDEPVRLSEHVYRITKANSTFAYALKRTVFDAFLELNRRADQVLDVNTYELQERFNCYCFVPNLAWVQTEYSDVQNKLERHWYLEKNTGPVWFARRSTFESDSGRFKTSWPKERKPELSGALLQRVFLTVDADRSGREF